MPHRINLTLNTELDLDKLPEGYLGSLPIRAEEWELAKILARGRTLANQLRGRKVPRNNDKQYWLDLKGSIAEVVLIGFLLDLNASGKLKGAFDCAALLDLVPARRPDLTLNSEYGSERFDIKGASGLIEGLSVRDDRLITVSQSQLKLYETGCFRGIFACKAYKGVLDVCYYSLQTVGCWTLHPAAAPGMSDYYATGIPVFKDAEQTKKKSAA